MTIFPAHIFDAIKFCLKKSWTFDIEADGLLDAGPLGENTVFTKLHCLVAMNVTDGTTYVFCDVQALGADKEKGFRNAQGVQFFDTSYIPRFVTSDKVDRLVCHNQFSYDLPVILRQFGVEYDVANKTLGGKHCDLVDSLSMSQTLYPDRPHPHGCPRKCHNPVTGKMKTIGSHGLESWGYRVANRKPQVDDWRNQPLHVYVNRCIEDVYINKDAYLYMLDEAGVLKGYMKRLRENGEEDVANRICVTCKWGGIARGKGGQWMDSIGLNQMAFDGMCRQERTGVLFDAPAARELVVEIDLMMKEIEDRVHPQLPAKVASKSNQPNFPKRPWKAVKVKKANFPKNPWKANGQLSAAAFKYAAEFGITDYEGVEREMERVALYGGEPRSLRTPEENEGELCAAAVNYCIKFGITDPAEQVAEMERVKLHGGTPRILTEPMTIGSQKDVKMYLLSCGWRPTLIKTKNLTVNGNKEARSKKEIAVAIDAYIEDIKSSPFQEFMWEELDYKKKPDFDSAAFREKIEKKARFVPSTPQLRDQKGDLCPSLERVAGPIAKDIILWLSLRNRRTTLMAMDEAKRTGWLHHHRLTVDGRLPAGSAGLTPTMRQKHRCVVNVPSVGATLGKEMRALFIASPGKHFITCDACGIEARIAGHFANMVGGDGGAYAELVLFGDYHTVMAEQYSTAAGSEVTRSAGKNVSYASLYGVAAKKLSKMLGVSQQQAQDIIDSFWDGNEGLKNARDAVIRYWEGTEKKYIKGLDGRKIYTRSKHSLLNALFQSAGAIIMDYAGIWARKRIEDHGCRADRVLFVHDEYSYEQDSEEIETYYFPHDHKPEQERDGRLFSKPILFRDGKPHHFFDKKEDRVLPTDQWVQYYSFVGESIALGIVAAGEHFNMSLPFPGEYLVGKNWSETH